MKKQDFSISILETSKNVHLFVFISWLVSFGVCIYINISFTWTNKCWLRINLKKKKKKELGTHITFSQCNYNCIKDIDHMNTLDKNFTEKAVNENCEITKTFFSHQCICWNQHQGDFFFEKNGNHSMQGWTTTARHRVIWKRSTKRF